MSAQTLTLHHAGLRARRTSGNNALTTSLSSRSNLTVPRCPEYRRYFSKNIRRFVNGIRRKISGTSHVHRAVLACTFTLIALLAALFRPSRSEQHGFRFGLRESFAFGTEPVVSQHAGAHAIASGFGDSHVNAVRTGHYISAHARDKLHKHTKKIYRRRAKTQHTSSNTPLDFVQDDLYRSVQSGRLVGNSAELLKLPPTRWLHNSHLRAFLPPRQRATDMRLIVLSHACYCTRRGKFVLPDPKGHSGHHFPGFIHRHRAGVLTKWKNPSDLLAFPSQKAYHVPGMTILWRGRSLAAKHPHLMKSLVAIRGIIDVVQRTTLGRDLKLAAEAFVLPNGRNTQQVRKLYAYFFGDIPIKSRISLRDHRPQLMCFDRVVAIGTEFEGHVATPDSFREIKKLIMKAEKPAMPTPLVKSCADSSANRDTIWIIGRQQKETEGGSMSNMAEVMAAVNNAIFQTGLAALLDTKVIQGVSEPCPSGTAREGCIAQDCNSVTKDVRCRKQASAVNEVQAFNNMTLLISISGSGLAGIPYMPKGAAIIEVVPHGVQLGEGDMDIARGAGIRLYHLDNTADSSIEQSLQERFGDVAASERACWADSECRSARLSTSTSVDVIHLKRLLKRMLLNWRRDCVV